MATRRRFGLNRFSQEENDQSTICRQIDNMENFARQKRDRILGPDWGLRVEEFFTIDSVDTGSGLWYRPRCPIAELQSIIQDEATDLSDMQPIIFIKKGDNKERDKDLEASIQAEWKDGNYDLEILNANVWSMMWGHGILEVTFDTDAYQGRGKIGVISRDPRQILVDPNAKNDEDPEYWISEDFMYIDEIRKRWPAMADDVEKTKPYGGPTNFGSMRLPPGPMAKQFGFGVVGKFLSMFTNRDDTDGRYRVRRTFMRDYAKIDIPKDDAEEDPRVRPILEDPVVEYKYPNGRLVVDCNNVILFDGENPWPTGIFPFVQVCAGPRVMGFYPVPPIKYTLGLQRAAELFTEQALENSIRVNNAYGIVKSDSGIDTDEVTGAPGIVYEANPQSQNPIEFHWTEPMPAQYLDLPQKLLQKQREIQGVTEARKGDTKAGNISAPLYDAAISQAQTKIRMRARFYGQSMKRLANIVLLGMAKFYTVNRSFLFPSDGDIDQIDWTPVEQETINQLEAFIDPASIRPMSKGALRMLVPILAQLKWMTPRRGLKLLDFPDADEMANELQQEQQQQALVAAATGGSHGKKK